MTKFVPSSIKIGKTIGNSKRYSLSDKSFIFYLYHEIGLSVNEISFGTGITKASICTWVRLNNRIKQPILLTFKSKV